MNYILLYSIGSSSFALLFLQFCPKLCISALRCWRILSNAPKVHSSASNGCRTLKCLSHQSVFLAHQHSSTPKEEFIHRSLVYDEEPPSLHFQAPGFFGVHMCHIDIIVLYTNPANTEFSLLSTVLAPLLQDFQPCLSQAWSREYWRGGQALGLGWALGSWVCGTKRLAVTSCRSGYSRVLGRGALYMTYMTTTPSAKGTTCSSSCHWVHN